MRTAARGLFVAYTMVVLSWLFVTQIARHVLPDIGKFGFVVFVGGPFIIVHGVALAIFWGSFVCAALSLYFHSTSSARGGYIVFALSAIPTLGLSCLWLRLMVIGH